MGLKCPYCKGEEVIKRGWRKTKFGKKQRYLCRGCNRRFVVDDGFKKMVYPKEIISEGISLHQRGLSFAKVSEHFEEYKGLKPNPSTIWKWERKYSKRLKEWEEKQEPKIKGPIHMDEVVVKVKGEKAYRWHAKDKKTRAINSSKRGRNGETDKVRQR